MDSLPLSPWGSLHCRGFGFDPWLGHHPASRSHCCLQGALFPQRHCSWSPLPWAPVWSGCSTQWSSWGCLPSSSWMPWLPPYWHSPLFSFYLPHIALQGQCCEVNFFLHKWNCPYWVIFELLFGGVSSIKVILLQRFEAIEPSFLFHSVLQRSLVDPNPPSFYIFSACSKILQGCVQVSALDDKPVQSENFSKLLEFFPVMYLIISPISFISPTSPFTCLLMGCL